MTTTADRRVLSSSFLLTESRRTRSIITEQTLALNMGTTKQESVFFEYSYKDRAMCPFFSFSFDRVSACTECHHIADALPMSGFLAFSFGFIGFRVRTDTVLATAETVSQTTDCIRIQTRMIVMKLKRDFDNCEHCQYTDVVVCPMSSTVQSRLNTRVALLHPSTDTDNSIHCLGKWYQTMK